MSRRRRKPSVFSRIEGDWRQLESRSLTQLVSSAFDGLVWRSRVAGAPGRRMDYYIRHFLLDEALICRCSGVDCRIQGSSGGDACAKNVAVTVLPDGSI